ncbi:hypothetical protein P692DRAFT_201710219, partial [Suillus brevipes Sb2]
DLDTIKDQVVKAHYKSIRDFEQRFRASIKSYEFEPGALVLVRNSKVEYELSKKTKPHYLGPMIVVPAVVVRYGHNNVVIATEGRFKTHGYYHILFGQCLCHPVQRSDFEFLMLTALNEQTNDPHVRNTWIMQGNSPNLLFHLPRSKTNRANMRAYTYYSVEYLILSIKY